MWASYPRLPQSTDPAPANCSLPRPLSPRGVSGPALSGRAPGPSPGHLSRRPRDVRDSDSAGLHVRSSRAVRVTSRTHHVKRGNESHFRSCRPVSWSLKGAAPTPPTRSTPEGIELVRRGILQTCSVSFCLDYLLPGKGTPFSFLASMCLPYFLVSINRCQALGNGRAVKPSLIHTLIRESRCEITKNRNRNAGAAL